MSTARPPFSGYTGVGGGGGGAPVNASYLVLGLDAVLTDERLFSPTQRFAATDNGPGNSYVLDLNVSGVGAGAYTNANITVDAYGRVTAAASGAAPAPTNAQYLTLAVDATLSQERVLAPTARFAVTDGGAGGNYTLDLASVVGVAGSYTYASLTVDGYGRVTAASNGVAPVTSVTGTAGRVTSTGGTTPQIDLANAGTAGTYGYPSSVTTDAYGRVTAITAGLAPPVSGWTDGGPVVYLTTSTDLVSIGNNVNVPNRKLSVFNTGTDLGASIVTLASTDNVLETKVSGEVNLRWSVDGTGATRWGPGGASVVDTRLYRSAPNTLTLDNNAGGAATFAPGADSQGALGTSSLRWATMAANAHNVFNALGDANPTSTLTSGTLRFGAGGASAADTRIYRSGGNTLTFDNGAGGSAVWVFFGTTTFQRTQYQTVTTAASPYVVLGTDNQVFANPGANQTITLPAASAAMLGRTIVVKRVNTSAFPVTVNTSGGNIDGAATRVLAGGTYDSITVTCALVGGVYDWYII